MRFVLLLLLAAAPLTAQEGVRLRFSPPIGQVSIYRTATSSQVEMPNGSQMSIEQVMYATQRVTAQSGGVTTVESVIDSMSMTGPAVIPGQYVAERLEGMRGAMRIDERGRVVDIEYEDSVVQEIAPGFSGQFSSSSPGQVVFPGGAIAPGQTWSDSGTTTISTDRGRMDMRHDLTYRLERLEARGRSPVAVISVTGTTSQAMMLGDTDTPAMTSEGTMRGEVTFDLATSQWMGHEVVIMMVSNMPYLPAPMATTVTMRGTLVHRD